MKAVSSITEDCQFYYEYTYNDQKYESNSQKSSAVN